MVNYSPAPWKSHVTELEIFLGTILGDSHKQTKQQREASKTMREEYGSAVDLVRSMIQDEESDRPEPLERSIACFYVALEDKGSSDPHTRPHSKLPAQKLVSFQWITAISCLQEVEKFRLTLPF